MKHRIFTISVYGDEVQMDEMNCFCLSHKIIQIEKQFVANGDNSFWSFCISYIESQEKLSTHNIGGNKIGRKERIDYKEVLNDDDFSIYSQLRELRKTLAGQEATPPYNIFTNEQLANIVRQNIKSKTDLLSLEGIGPMRVEKYGDLFINHLQSIVGNTRNKSK